MVKDNRQSYSYFPEFISELNVINEKHYANI